VRNISKKINFKKFNLVKGILFFCFFLFFSSQGFSENSSELDAKEAIALITKNYINNKLISNLIEAKIYNTSSDYSDLILLRENLKDESTKNILDDVYYYLGNTTSEMKSRVRIIIKREIIKASLIILSLDRKIVKLKTPYRKINHTSEVSDLIKLKVSILESLPILQIDDLYFEAQITGKKIIRQVKKYYQNKNSNSQNLIDPIDFYFNYVYSLPANGDATAGKVQQIQINENFNGYKIVDPFDIGFDEKEDVEDYLIYAKLKKESNLEKLKKFTYIKQKNPKQSFNIKSKYIDEHIDARLELIATSIKIEIEKIDKMNVDELLDLLKFQNIKKDIRSYIEDDYLRKYFDGLVSKQNNKEKYIIGGTLALGLTVLSAFFPANPLIFSWALCFDALTTYFNLKNTFDLYKTFDHGFYLNLTGILSSDIVSSVEYNLAYSNFILSYALFATNGIITANQALIFIKNRPKLMLDSLNYFKNESKDFARGLSKMAKNPKKSIAEAWNSYIDIYKDKKKLKQMIGFVVKDSAAVLTIDYLARMQLSDTQNQFIITDRNGEWHFNRQTSVNFLQGIMLGVLSQGVYWVNNIFYRALLGEISCVIASSLSQGMLWIKDNKFEFKRIIFDVNFGLGFQYVYETQRKIIFNSTMESLYKTNKTYYDWLYFFISIIRKTMKSSIQTPLLDKFFGNKLELTNEEMDKIMNEIIASQDFNEIDWEKEIEELFLDTLSIATSYNLTSQVD
jgi:hypothetical protein